MPAEQVQLKTLRENDVQITVKVNLTSFPFKTLYENDLQIAVNVDLTRFPFKTLCENDLQITVNVELTRFPFKTLRENDVQIAVKVDLTRFPFKKKSYYIFFFLKLPTCCRGTFDSRRQLFAEALFLGLRGLKSDAKIYVFPRFFLYFT